MIYEKYLKRPLDFVGALIMMPILGIVAIVVAIVIKLDDHGSVFYLAKRRGRDGNTFNMYKFRSMKMNAKDIRNKDNSTYNAPDDPRITRVGNILRKLSIDELPQIINVLKGDMSFIGPRPVTTDRPLSQYDEKRLVRLKVRPGISGYSQAYYRNSIDQETKLQYDAYYATHVTFLGDMKIILKTIETVFKKKNIYINNPTANNTETAEFSYSLERSKNNE